MTFAGGTFRFLRDTWIALAGARMPAQIDGQSVEMWQALPVNAGQTLALGAAEGLRTYLCVRGGFAAQEILDSRATCVSGGWGGWEGRALREGDLLRSEDAAANPPTFRGRSLTLRRMYAEEISVLRVTRGPQWDGFSDQARELFFAREFEVTDECNRLGLRLNGPLLEVAASQRESEMLSEGIANGAVQVASGGSPIILFCEQTTTGGYPKIANVIHADLFRLGQLKPGDKFHFKEVTREEARRLSQELDGSLQSLGFTS